ncbi:putative MPP superfamily phosphohydrolase [Paenibacillus phyllosphaerae]|uniref:Putative MPP superfamily phosphohydrolase n=1 Tax=Paenibacillus phyllosphaerae TaxID=274593 RepID=A0A7W5AUY2_9BACL|nr:metallophosphoesterase [Paenibacillus phyllosphaerae]MBB3109250.1 putative MPP superfamily phosphohydrolase [Paenibacillus phyllosphaerae]
MVFNGILIILLLAAAGIAILSWMVREANKHRLDAQTVHLAELPASFEGTRVLFLSDVHAREIPDLLIQHAKEDGPVDLVLIGGDLREHGVPLERSRSNIRKLLTLAPVYMVYGNHDYDEDIRSFDVMLREEGVRVLINESVILEQQDGARVRLAGTDDPRTLREDVAMTLSHPEVEPGICTIMLAHDPEIIERLSESEERQINLIMSGHTHGGQIVLPLIGPLVISSNIRKYTYGWFTFDGKKQTTATDVRRLFVSRGLGTSKFPLRLGAPAEYHIFTLKSGSSR